MKTISTKIFNERCRNCLNNLGGNTVEVKCASEGLLRVSSTDESECCAAQINIAQQQEQKLKGEFYHDKPSKNYV
jgi:hypothetical protein